MLLRDWGSFQYHPPLPVQSAAMLSPAPPAFGIPDGKGTGAEGSPWAFPLWESSACREPRPPLLATLGSGTRWGYGSK